MTDEQRSEQTSQPEPEPTTELVSEEPINDELAEPTPEPEVENEPTPEMAEAVKTPQELLAEEVNTCFATGMCQRLGKRFDEVAEQLGIEVNTLIDEVFAIAKGKKAEQTEG